MNVEYFPSISRIAESLFSDIEKESEDGKQITKDHLRSLHVLFDRQLPRALRIVDSGGVKCFVAQQSRRKVFQVQGKGPSDVYTVFPHHFCSCHSFFYDVASKGNAVYCKHQLAALVASSVKRCPLIIVPDAQLAAMLMAL
eukprot:jgi/Botrbrau1/10067/Bobra.0355s0022.1